jgi:hypothetical protein
MAQVAGTCYSSTQHAVAAIASAEVGKVVPVGSSVYVVDALPGPDGSSITYTLTPVAGGAPIVKTASVHVPPCMLLDWSDGLALGWAVAAVWVAVAVVLHLREAAHS